MKSVDCLLLIELEKGIFKMRIDWILFIFVFFFFYFIVNWLMRIWNQVWICELRDGFYPGIIYSIVVVVVVVVVSVAGCGGRDEWKLFWWIFLVGVVRSLRSNQYYHLEKVCNSHPKFLSTVFWDNRSFGKLEKICGCYRE